MLQTKILEEEALKVRREIVSMLYQAGSGHPGGSLSIVEVLVSLYNRIYVDSDCPDMEDRDRVVLSKGHGAPALYAILAEHVFFSANEFKRLRDKVYPERFFDIGIAEQNLMGAAAGMAAAGLKPYASTFALFAAGRAYEPIRNLICYGRLPVNIVATHAGLSSNSDGGSHQSIEDLALMRVLPGMTVLSPCDYNQAKDMIMQMKDRKGPCYIRLSRHPVTPVTLEGAHTRIGKIDVLEEGGDVCITATGSMVGKALEAAKILKKKGVRAAVLNVHTIKPLDKDTIIQYAARCGYMVTAEEHSIIGGLGGAVCEAIGEQAGITGCQVVRCGIGDRFGQSGDLDELMEFYGLTAVKLADTAYRLICQGKEA